MHKYLFPVAYLSASAVLGVLAHDVSLGFLFSRRNTPVLGDICKSLRRACNIPQLPDTIEKLCNEYCEKSIDEGDLKGELCGNYKKYIDSWGKCADGVRSIVDKQCKDKCRCSSDEDCGQNEACKDHVCKPKAECHHNRECNGKICKDSQCVPCTSNQDCAFQPNLKCSEGKCVAIIVPPPECTKNSDCKPGRICSEGDCTLCSTDSQCDKDQFCSEGECMPKPPTCGQPGFEWAQWRGPSSWSGVKSPPFAEYDPTVFKSQKPEHNGLTNTLLINNANDLYGQVVAINLASVVHQGFLLAPETGNYTFIFGQADDIVLVWLGKNAFSGWTRANADIERTYIPPPGDETHTTRHLDQGTYYPVRVAWGDKGGNVAMSVKITAPNGMELTGKDGGYFRTEACDGSYDKFPPFGES